MLLFLKSEEVDRKNCNSIWFRRYNQKVYCGFKAVLGTLEGKQNTNKRPMDFFFSSFFFLAYRQLYQLNAYLLKAEKIFS